MTNDGRKLIEGQPVLIVIDIQGGPATSGEPSSMPFMPGYHKRMDRAPALVEAARACDVPVLLKGLGADTLLLIGGHTDVCVHYTFVDAYQHDYFCRVVEDCVAGSSSEAHEASLRAMEYLQAGARRNSTDVVAAFDEFRDRHSTQQPLEV